MALYLLMALTDSVVVLVAPAWVSYPSQVTLAGKRSIVIQTTYEDGWKLTPHSLTQAVERQAQPYENKLVIFTNPGNPTGQVYTAEELRELAEVFRKYKMIVVSDEIYSYLTYDEDFVSLSKFYPEGTVITTGLSKWASGGGWRTGYAMFPPELSFLRNLLGSAASHTFTCAPVPQQCAVAEYFNNHEACAEYMKHALGSYTLSAYSVAGKIAYCSTKAIIILLLL
ncbi:hypothetical protein EB796_013464 [Bugula neritina]|uniref:Aminotransferase class I/classII large domain-containing protein n=1 Tax=Bugula neritina TaxID=10212 RepID=A0A7J7JS36_BUGNE|nr:hypothetical protein EB796_013464 [Bugula neritina]